MSGDISGDMSDDDKIKAEEAFRANVLGASILLAEMERVHGDDNWREIAQDLALRVKMLESWKRARESKEGT